MPDRRAILAGGGLLFTAVLAPVVEPRRYLARELPPLHLETDVPKEFGPWQMDASIAQVLPSPDVQAMLESTYNQQLSRTYVERDSGYRIMLLIAYGENQIDKLTVAHLPEGCYPAQGFRIVKLTVQSIMKLGETNLPVARLVAQKGTRNEPITYWTTVGGRSFSSDYARRYARIRDALEGVIPDGMLVRISSIDPSESRAFGFQGSFLKDFTNSLSASVRRRILG